MHFSEIIKLQFGIGRHTLLWILKLYKILFINYLRKMRGYPQFSFGISITLVKICFSRVVSKPRKNTFELVDTVLKNVFTSHPNALAEIRKAQINLDLGDVCRDQNPLTTRYTWRRRNPDVSSRLDFFLMSYSRCIYGKVTNSDILPRYKTNHSFITVNLGVTENP